MNARAEWLAERRTGIGGSDVAAVLGLSPYSTPLQVWLDKRGQLPEQPDNDSMLWGRMLEPAIRQRYADVTGRSVRMPNTPHGIVRHPSHSFMLATLDGFTDDGRNVQVKTARSGADWGEPGTDQIPDYYIPQVQHEMVVSGLLVTDVPVLIAGSDFRIYTVEADPELQAMLVESEAEFWRSVVDGVEPAPRNFSDVKMRFNRSRDGSVEASPEVVAACLRLGQLKENIKALEARSDSELATITEMLGELDTLVSGGLTLATWKSAKPSQKTDWKAAFEHVRGLVNSLSKQSDVAQHFAATLLPHFSDAASAFTTTQAGSRRFLLK